MRNAIARAHCAALGTLLLLASVSTAADYSLEAFSLRSTTPVTITFGPGKAADGPVYLPPGGEWSPLEVVEVDGTRRCAVAANGGGQTIVLMSKPAWLTLPDAEAPQFTLVKINDTDMQPEAGRLELGWRTAAPQSVVVAVSDALNPVAASRALATLDGRALADFGGAVDTQQTEDGKSATIAIRLGQLPRDKHTLSLSVPDATPHANTLTLAVAFDTSPLLLNGDFEQGGGAAFATHWRHAAWGRKPETQYETVVAQGEGRSGNAVKLTGIADPLYLIVGQEISLQAGQSYVFSGYYRTEADQKLGVSLVGTQAGELKQQYVESPPFTPSTEWAPFEWEVLAEAGHPEFEVFLWSKSKGSVWFDDLQLMPKQ